MRLRWRGCVQWCAMATEVTWHPVPRPELPSLQGIADKDERLFLRMYLRSNMDADQDIAKARCEKHGIDYQAAKAEAQLS